MSDINHAGSDLIFELEDRPPFHQALVGAITHLLAIFVPMVTPALIVGAALQLSAETTAYLVSMAMIASGIGTWLQVNRYGIVGSGLLSIQSVNFSFVTVMIALGSSMKSDGFHEELIMSSLLGVSYDPEIFKILPASIYVLVENPICAGGLTAILLNIILPGGYRQENVLPGITSAEEMD
ncbi:TPA: hypothetical protein L2R50_003183 [Escherichia coli O25b:H4-ST131]|nr:hypothetical protein [Escherichia coli O25b:H4-ST131]